eukprot:scpid99520/ scgid22423/ 
MNNLAIIVFGFAIVASFLPSSHAFPQRPDFRAHDVDVAETERDHTDHVQQLAASLAKNLVDLAGQVHYRRDQECSWASDDFWMYRCAPYPVNSSEYNAMSAECKRRYAGVAKYCNGVYQP